LDDLRQDQPERGDGDDEIAVRESGTARKSLGDEERNEQG
jgi:hypothetical protein